MATVYEKSDYWFVLFSVEFCYIIEIVQSTFRFGAHLTSRKDFYVFFTFILLRRRKMADLITPVLVGIFGVVTVLVVMTFVLIRKQSGKPRFETKDYYKSYKRSDGYSSGGNPFRQGPLTQDRKEQRFCNIRSHSDCNSSSRVSIFFDVFEGLLIIFLLPVVVRFIRMRDEANSNRNKARDESRSSY